MHDIFRRRRAAGVSLEVLYWTTVAAFFTHELDAVKRHEWRVLPLTTFLPERLGEQVFIWAHVPLFLAILLFSRDHQMSPFRLGLSASAVAHAQAYQKARLRAHRWQNFRVSSEILSGSKQF